MGESQHVTGRRLATYDVIHELRNAYAPYGTTIKDLPDSVPQTRAPRGKSCSAMRSEYIHAMRFRFGLDAYTRFRHDTLAATGGLCARRR